MNGVELVASWFTPTVLFCVLNFMIGTIFITSSLKPPKQQEKLGGHDDGHRPQLVRVPSFFERVKSINLSRHRAEQSDHVHYAVPAQEQEAHLQHQHQEKLGGHDDDQPPQLSRVPSFFERVMSINLSRHRAEQPNPVHDAVPAQEQEPEYETEEPHHVTRTKSDTVTQVTATATAAVRARVLKKCLSEKVEAVVVKGEEEVEADPRRPATTRERTAASGGEDEAVDAKADDFINRFRQQLKLQRLDSILRYREMLNRGTAR
ncbi:Pathogen-associated molecular patterns-induced protein A70 [Sesamum alatum]|uniref:Pathogen-associated molecular patterns-induced protein A70 n=1 Tax=Sesamum alatum TaxID=300844 RepID=A0AAE2CB37_9LAMI|nr:Pathogen-associated molecular patterns-induced protein A70 [Sesamum alatum]